MIDFLLHSSASPYIRAASLIVTVAMMLFMSRQGDGLKNDYAPYRIMSLELAWTKACADKIVHSWDTMKDVAIRQVHLDFVFIAGYALLLFYMAFAAERAAVAAGYTALAYAAHLAAFGGLVAGALDCLENAGLLLMLSGPINGAIAFATSLFATLKFVLIAATFGVAIATFVAA
jgi:hypothetical protein